MRTLLLTFAVIIFSSIHLYGCSGEQPSNQPTRNPVIVKKPIKKPAPENLQAESATPAEKDNTKSAAGPSPALEEKARSSAARMESEGQSKPTGESLQKVEAGQPRTDTRSKAGSVESKGYYLVKNGDTLAGIAGKREVYGNRLKWAILYRMNAQALDSMPAADHLPDLPLPEGIRLGIVTPEEVTSNLERRSGSIWVVNVLSATTNAEVIPALISLVKNDYPVYVSTARVNEKDWMRVRVGFFRTKEQAEEEGKKIMQLLSLRDSWVTRLAKTEFAEFAGY